jgi:hypothetical protein
MMTPDLLDRLRRWADTAMQRDPDFALREDGVPYLLRWEMVGSTPEHHVYLHRIVDSEREDRLHGHPWPSVSIILSGRYIDHMDKRQQLRVPGDVVYRPMDERHRMELIPGEDCSTLFLTGNKAALWRVGRYDQIGDFAR